MTDSKKMVAEQKEWNKVSQELEAENLKLAYYDDTLVSLLGDVKEKNILDYGAGPGVLALALQKLGAEVKVYDINNDMRKSAGEKIGSENIYSNVEEIPNDFFDFIIANLVVCIVPEEEVKQIMSNIKNSLNSTGFAFIGFCNPKIFDVEESNIDFRFPTGAKYEENHEYKKVKKEGSYEIIESHRPIEWYEKVFKEAGLQLVDTVFTPEYEKQGLTIKDFVIFKLKR